jgi:glutamate--cysteine ligase
MVALAEAGLKRRARLDRHGEDERKALTPLIAIVDEGRSPSDGLLAAYHGPWQGEIDKVFDVQSF